MLTEDNVGVGERFFELLTGGAVADQDGLLGEKVEGVDVDGGGVGEFEEVLLGREHLVLLQVRPLAELAPEAKFRPQLVGKF